MLGFIISSQRIYFLARNLSEYIFFSLEITLFLHVATIFHLAAIVRDLWYIDGRRSRRSMGTSDLRKIPGIRRRGKNNSRGGDDQDYMYVIVITSFSIFLRLPEISGKSSSVSSNLSEIFVVVTLDGRQLMCSPVCPVPPSQISCRAGTQCDIGNEYIKPHGTGTISISEPGAVCLSFLVTATAANTTVSTRTLQVPRVLPASISSLSDKADIVATPHFV